MSKLRKNKVASKSQGEAAAPSMKIDELFKVQAERQVSRSSASSLQQAAPPYFSPEKQCNLGLGDNDGATGRRLNRLSKRFRKQSVNEVINVEEGKNPVGFQFDLSENESSVKNSVASKRKVSNDKHKLPEYESAKKLKLTSSGSNQATECLSGITDHGDGEHEQHNKNCISEHQSKIIEKAKTVLLSEECSVNLPSPERESLSVATADGPSKSEFSNQESKQTPEPNSGIEVLPKRDSNEESPEEDEDTETIIEDDDMGDYTIPYYLENFQVILKTVLGDEFYVSLFNEEDHKVVETFKNLTGNGQKLYIRLFQRKYRWLRKDKISYPKIAEDLSEIIEELVNQGFILDERKMDELEEILVALPSPELKQLAKSLRINAAQQMSDLAQAILKHSRQTNISNFFMVKSKEGGTATMITNRAKTLLGSCYKLSKTERDVFIRAVMLFSLHQIDGDMDEASGGQTQLFQMLMTNIGRMVYPSYVVNKQTRVFRSRTDVIRFQKAVIMEDDIFEAMDKHHFDEAMELYKNGYNEWKIVWEDKSISRHDESLAEHLRMYTAGSVYARVLTYGVEVLQKKRLYKEAVVLLEELLQQKVYQPSYRGRWYDRLALNLDQHLKQHSKALDVIKEALADDMVRFGHRYSLFQRAQRICNSPSKKKLKNRWKEFMEDTFMTVMEAPTVTIEGKLLTKNTQFAVYVTDEHPDQESEKTLSKRVEDVALAHYRENGYPQGVHGEGSSFVFLLVLFMWDVFYNCSVPDTFLNPYHVFPLDLRTDHFYESRKDEIENALELLRKSSAEELTEKLGESWSKHEGVLGVNWEIFESLEHAQGLVRCVGGPHLAAIFERMIKNMRYTCSGFPDLVVWNPETLKFRISEVKGPGDRLSVKQILWLDYLVNFGIQAETCYVRAVGCKRL